MKAGIAEPEETAVARQRLSRHLSLATYTHATIYELLAKTQQTEKT
jgi:hypothetical protein